MSGSIVQAYDRAVSRGEIENDPAQRELAERLDRLATELAQGVPQIGFLSMLRPKARAPRGPERDEALNAGATQPPDVGAGPARSIKIMEKS